MKIYGRKTEKSIISSLPPQIPTQLLGEFMTSGNISQNWRKWKGERSNGAKVGCSK
jgi:hypothetical protein